MHVDFNFHSLSVEIPVFSGEINEHEQKKKSGAYKMSISFSIVPETDNFHLGKYNWQNSIYLCELFDSKNGVN